MPQLQGSVPAGGAPRVTGPCLPPLFAIWGLAHRAPGHRPGLRPRFPLPPAYLLLCGAAGGGRRAAGRALRRDLLPPSSAVRGAWHSQALRAAAWVSGQRVRRGLHCRARLRIARRRLVPTCRARVRCGPPGSGVTPLSDMSWRADGPGGVCPGSGGHVLPGGAPRAVGLHPPPVCFPHQGSGARPTGRRARLLDGRCQPSGRWRHCPRVPPSAAPPLVWGLGLRRWRVPRAVAQVDKGGTQGPGLPDIGLLVCDAEHCPRLRESQPSRLLVRSSCLNHGSEDPFVVLSGHPTPQGYFSVPPVTAGEHGIEWQVPHVP